MDIAGNIPTYSDWFLQRIEQMSDDSFISREFLMDAVNNIFQNLLTAGTMESIANGLMSFANGIINFVIALTVSLYILLDRDNLAKSFDKMATAILPSSQKETIYKYARRINHVLFTFIASKGLDSIINFVAVSTILLVLDVRYALLLGLLAGIANFIPYLGSLVAVIVISIITLITGTPVQAMYTLIFLIIFQQLDGNFIEPKIMGTTLKMSPILVIFAVIVGGAYFGIVGMFLGVPVVAVVKQVIEEFVESKKHKQKSPELET